MPPRKCYPVTVTTTAATLPARYASMVSELSIAAPRNDFPGGDLNPWRSTLGSSNRSRWWSDQWDSGNSEGFGGESNPRSSAGDDDGRDFFKKRQFNELGGRPSLLEGQYSRSLHLSSRRGGFLSAQVKQIQISGSRTCGNHWRETSIHGEDGKMDDRQEFDELLQRWPHWNYEEEAKLQATNDLLRCIVDHRVTARSRSNGEREAVIHACNQVELWLWEKLQQQDAPSHKIRRQIKALDTACRSIMGMEDDVDDVDDNDSEDLVADECARLTATEKEQDNTLPVWNINEDGESDEDGNVDEEPRCDKKDEEVWSSDDEDDEYDNGNISVEESDSEERADDLSVDIGVDSVGKVVFEGGVRRNADEKNIRISVQADEAVAYGASLPPILSCKGDVKVHDLLLENVISLSLGPDSVEELVTVLTPENTTMRKELAKDDEKDVDEENKENVAIEGMCKLMKRFWNVEEIRDAADVVVAASVVVLVVKNVSDVVASARHEELIPSLVTKKDMIITRRVEFFTCNSREGFMAVFDPGGSPCGKISSSIGLLARALSEEELVQPLHTLHSELRPLPIVVAPLEQVYKARSTGVEYSVHLASPELPPAWQTQILDWFCWWEEYYGGVNELQLMKRMREEDEFTGVHKFLYGASSIPKLKMQGKSDKVIQGGGHCVLEFLIHWENQLQT